MAGGLGTLGRSLRRTGLLASLILLAIMHLAAAARAAEVKVVVTIKPVHSLVARVMEGVATPVLLVDGAASPHSFALKPSQVRAIAAAGMLVRVSERLEPFTGKIARSLPASVELVDLMAAPGLRLLGQRHNGTFEVDDHAHAAADDAVKDSHIWLDPENAKAIGSYVAGVLAARFPEHAAQFTANAARLSRDIDALSEELSVMTRPLRGRPFVVFHDAYQYFDARFHLDAVGSITVSPDVQPSAKRLGELRARIRALAAVCVFAEPLFQPQLVAAVIEGTHARAGTLDPEGLGLTPGPQLYFTLMRNLAGSLKACLDPAS
jgi:zinc transport system substrate-binding protein